MPRLDHTAFVNACRNERGVGHHTLRADAQDLRTFARFKKMHQLDDPLSRDDILAYLHHIRDVIEAKPATIERRLSTLAERLFCSVTNAGNRYYSSDVIKILPECMRAALRKPLDGVRPTFEDHPTVEVTGCAELFQVCIKITIRDFETAFQFREACFAKEQDQCQSCADGLMKNRQRHRDEIFRHASRRAKEVLCPSQVQILSSEATGTPPNQPSRRTW